MKNRDDIIWDLTQNYDDLYHEDPEFYFPEQYEGWLDGLTDDKLLQEHKERLPWLWDDEDDETALPGNGGT